MAWDTCKCGCSGCGLANVGDGSGKRWRTVALVLCLLAMAGAGGPAVSVHAKGAGAEPAAGTTQAWAIRVVVELFQVALVDTERLRYVRRERPLDRRGPDAVVAELLQSGEGALPFLVGTPAIVHSTSWRYENDGTVVLTYVAFGERITPKAETWGDVRTVAKAQLPDLGVTDPDHPRPKSIEHADVLSHGLRHLALLARRRGGNQAFIERLSERSRKFFSSIEPELAGEIGGSNMLVPSDSEAR